jgi:hypothetical protein
VRESADHYRAVLPRAPVGDVATIAGGSLSMRRSRLNR